MAHSVARESTLHCKLDSPLHWAPVRSIFRVGGKSIMEIPVETFSARTSRWKVDDELCSLADDVGAAGGVRFGTFHNYPGVE